MKNQLASEMRISWWQILCTLAVLLSAAYYLTRDIKQDLREEMSLTRQDLREEMSLTRKDFERQSGEIKNQYVRLETKMENWQKEIAGQMNTMREQARRALPDARGYLTDCMKKAGQ